MKKRALDIFKFLFFLSLGCLLVWLAVKDKTDEELANIKIALHQADYSWIIFSLVLSTFSHIVRALRWKLLLEPLNHFPKLSNTFFAVMVGYLANFALPRLGEVSRCGVLNRYEKVPFTEGFGTVIAERALDMICLILLFFIILGLEFTKIYGIANDLIFDTISQKMHALFQNKRLLLTFSITAVFLTTAFFYFRKKIKILLGAKIKGFVKGLWDGLKSIKNVKKPILFISYTVFIWFLYILQVYICFFAFNETGQLSLNVAAVIVVFGSLGIIAVPGGTGAYQVIVIQILTTVYFISSTTAFAFAWAGWTSQFVIIIFLGLISLLLLPLLNKEKKKNV